MKINKLKQKKQKLVQNFAKMLMFWGIWSLQKFFIFLKKSIHWKSRDFGVGLLDLKGLFLQIAKQHHYYKIILLSYMFYCHLIQNPYWDASQWCHIKKLKKNHWAWNSGFFFSFDVKYLAKISKNLANLVKFYTRKSWKQKTPKISQIFFWSKTKIIAPTTSS
jgi:hypothetical protein